MRPHWHIDFETYSEVNLKESGAFRYAEDPSTRVLILAFSNGVSDPVAVDLTQPDYLERLTPLFDAIRGGAIICAHNATFERKIWQEVCRHWPVHVPEAQWDCTAARARMIAIPGSLDGAANALGLKTRKDPRGQELIQIFSIPGKRGRVLPSDQPEAFREFMDYCRQDVRVEVELDRILPQLSPQEKDAFLLDYRINDRGMPVNIGLVEKADAFVGEYSETILKRAEDISGCRPSQREKTLAFLESRGFELPNLQAGTVEAFAKRPGVPQDLVELMDHRIELSRAGTKKLKTIKSCVSADGRIRGGFLFSAASTRRWSSVGVQMHNLQKPEGETNPEVVLEILDGDANDLGVLFSRPLTSVAQSIRGFFESPKHLLVADYSSVEPRGLAWSSGEKWLLEAYYQKQDAYKIAAGKVFGVPPDQIDAGRRFVGKQLILGCGYGMGSARFIETCLKFGRTLTGDEAAEAVYGYRQSVPAITAFWRGVEKACITAVKKWREVRYGKFLFRPEILPNGFQVLYVDMPSGSICYPVPSIGEELWNGEMRDTFNFFTPLGQSWIKTDTFGGSLVENIIQALTRDILRDGMVAADKAGFYLIGHCHDEAIAEGENNKDDLKEFERILCESSPWAEGFPIATEGYISRRYRK